MARNLQVLVCLAVAGATLFSNGATAQSSSNSCQNTLVSLSPCLGFITGNDTKPTKSCCTQLGNVVSSQPECLCQVIGGGGGSSLGIQINQTQALALPGACGVQTPPTSQCNNAGSPAGSPNTPSSGTGGGSGRTSPDGTSSSDGNTAKLTLTLLFSGIFLASYSSVFPTAAGV